MYLLLPKYIRTKLLEKHLYFYHALPTTGFSFYIREGTSYTLVIWLIGEYPQKFSPNITQFTEHISFGISKSTITFLKSL